jgi:hypothetical protein
LISRRIHMSRKRGVIQTDATRRNTETPLRDPGAMSGLLTGVLALAGLRTGELPRPVAIAGLISAAAGLLSPLYFVKEPAGWFIPVGARVAGAPGCW